jgi:hypothetical protein
MKSCWLLNNVGHVSIIGFQRVRSSCKLWSLQGDWKHWSLSGHQLCDYEMGIQNFSDFPVRTAKTSPWRRRAGRSSKSWIFTSPPPLKMHCIHWPWKLQIVNSRKVSVRNLKYKVAGCVTAVKWDETAINAQTNGAAESGCWIRHWQRQCLVTVRLGARGGPSDKLGADEGGHPTPLGGLQRGVKSRGLAIRLNGYLTAKKKLTEGEWVTG